jgi:hypothetical protein
MPATVVPGMLGLYVLGAYTQTNGLQMYWQHMCSGFHIIFSDMAMVPKQTITFEMWLRRHGSYDCKRENYASVCVRGARSCPTARQQAYEVDYVHARDN